MSTQSVKKTITTEMNTLTLALSTLHLAIFTGTCIGTTVHQFSTGEHSNYIYLTSPKNSTGVHQAHSSIFCVDFSHVNGWFIAMVSFWCIYVLMEGVRLIKPKIIHTNILPFHKSVENMLVIFNLLYLSQVKQVQIMLLHSFFILLYQITITEDNVVQRALIMSTYFVLSISTIVFNNFMTINGITQVFILCTFVATVADVIIVADGEKVDDREEDKRKEEEISRSANMKMMLHILKNVLLLVVLILIYTIDDPLHQKFHCG